MLWQREAKFILKAKQRLKTVRAVAVEFGLSTGKVSEFCRLGRALEKHPELAYIEASSKALEKLKEIEDKLRENFREINRGHTVRKGGR